MNIACIYATWIRKFRIVIEPEPIKHTPLLSKLINGDHHTAQSKNDKNIATSMKFFSNNSTSFKQYKGQDELDWIVKHHRLLTLELLTYTLNQHSSVATLQIEVQWHNKNDKIII